MSAPLAQQVALTAALRARDELVRAAKAVPAGRRMWQPGGVARHSVRIVAHCATSNFFLAAVFASAPLPYRTHEDQEAAMDACAGLDQAEQLLNRSVAAVCDAIVAIAADRLNEIMIMPWAERMPVALGLISPALHMQHHTGQINYIQSLLGDDEHH